MKYFYELFLIAALCIALFTPVKGATDKQVTNTISTYKFDSAAPKEVIIKFLRWYKNNLHKANSFPILIKDSSDNFMVNKKATSGYLALLKSSGCVSQRYIAYWKSFFDDKAIGLKNNPVHSDIPEGFDLDLVLVTQEPEVILDHIDKIRFKTISTHGNAAVISLNWPGIDRMQYNFEMNKGKTGWQITYISTPNFD